MLDHQITQCEFVSFRDYIYDEAGISLNDSKVELVASRLASRLRHYSLHNYEEYFELMMNSPKEGERQVAIDLLTTNETYFFREVKHFSFLQNEILPQWRGHDTFRVWSAASSTGEEAYSIAMLLDDVLATRPWAVFGSDINHSVLEKARQGLFRSQRIDGIPKAYLRKYCLKGVDEHEGSLLVDRRLCSKVTFAPVNLTSTFSGLGPFNVIFLRNVLIYFDAPTKRKIITNIIKQMKPGAYLFVGHTESLDGIHDGVKAVTTAVYQQPKYVSH